MPGASGILWGVILGLVIGKPVGVCATAWVAIKTQIARMPEDVALRIFVGAAFLYGIRDTVALLMADHAFPGAANSAAIAKIGVLIGSVLAAALGVAIIAIGSPLSGRTVSTESNLEQGLSSLGTAPSRA